jgi:hypothetical protein
MRRALDVRAGGRRDDDNVNQLRGPPARRCVMSKPIDLITEQPGGRRADIAWLRILAVLLLFPFHTARVFDVWDEFYVKNDQLSTALTWLIAYMEPWHMPLLFLLAGAASWFALGRRSGGAYSRERVKRLLIPFAFGLLVLIPPQSYLGLLSHSGSAPGYLQWLPDFFQLNEADLDGYATPAGGWSTCSPGPPPHPASSCCSRSRWCPRSQFPRSPAATPSSSSPSSCSAIS